MRFSVRLAPIAKEAMGESTYTLDPVEPYAKIRSLLVGKFRPLIHRYYNALFPLFPLPLPQPTLALTSRKE